MTVRYIVLCKWSGTWSDCRLDMYVYVNAVVRVHSDE